MHTVRSCSRWLHQHPEEREEAMDAQLASGGGGDTEAKMR
jgi:hypothetical protein